MSDNEEHLPVNPQEQTTTPNAQLIELRQCADHYPTDKRYHDSPPPKSRTLPPRTLTRNWISEIVCCFIALGCLFAIIALLYSFDGQALPQWRYGITLNTIVSLLATFMIFSITVPVTACMGQLKWLRLHQERQLVEFEMIENASRGPLGAFLLLICGKGGFYAYFGAGLVIGMLAIGPFLQQVVNNSTQTIKSDGASIPVASSYTFPLSTNGVLHSDVDLSMKSALLGGLLSNNDSPTQFDVPVTCSTGNCTWQDYNSLAVCASCIELTARLIVSTQSSNITGYAQNVFHKLPNGLYLKTYEGQQGIQMTVNNTMQEGGAALPSIAFQDHKNTLLDMFVIALDNETSTDSTVYGPYAAECIIEFCWQDYTAKVTEGTFHETRNDKGDPLEGHGNGTYEVEDDGSKIGSIATPSTPSGSTSRPCSSAA